MSAGLTTFANGASVPVGEIPSLPMATFREVLLAAGARGARLVALFPLRPGGGDRVIVAVVALDEESLLGVVAGAIGDAGAYPSLTPQWPQAQAFERELWESQGIEPQGHPWLKPLSFPSLPEGTEIPALYPYFSARGEEVHEVAVGPVHAGVIEPGHFRFQCHGEEVLHLEIQLGYQHRGAESLMREGTPSRRIAVAESVAGDCAIAHATAFASAEEALSGAPAPARAQALRAVALELERVANHVGDLGALAGDVGYLPSASFFGRLRGEFLNLTTGLCGNRTGRGLVAPGGVRFDADPGWVTGTLRALGPLRRDLQDTAGLLFGSSSVQSRFEGAGVMAMEVAEALGVVGPAARASGCRRDVRQDHPAGFYRFAQVPLQALLSGDVYARAMVRWMEIQQSLRFVEEQLSALPGGAIRAEGKDRRPGRLAVALVEGWRGEVAHAAVTDEGGEVAAYHGTDPSFHNWMGLALAMRGVAISDFPLCNKSFNLSYAGHDR
jgi:Ni,Fe-hydrogenase III large subunit